MNYSCLQLNDLPDEILLIIFKKLNNVTLLSSLFDVNKRLNQIVSDPILISHLNLLKFCSTDSISRLSYPILDRFCFQILPNIHHGIKWLNLESLSMKRVLLSANYPNLNGLGLYNLEMVQTKNFFSDETLFPPTLKEQILSLVIYINQNKEQLSARELSTFIFVHIVNKFTNLRYLNYAPSSNCYQQLSFDISPPSFVSSNLFELYVNLDQFNDCLHLLDGRFGQLRTLHVNIPVLIPSRTMSNNKDKLPNLRCFVLSCEMITNDYDQLLVPLLHRMLNLEELALKFSVFAIERFVDGNNLKDMINPLTQLNKFTFNILSTIRFDNQIDLVTNEIIENTFRNFKYNEVICYVDYFSEEAEVHCHIYSYPYIWETYNSITNLFRGGLFNCVREISLFDERPFEHTFFLRIAQSFPLVKKLTLKNEKQQENKRSRKSFNAFSIISYPHLTTLFLNEAHHDYYEEFLLDTQTSLPNNICLVINYQRLKKVTHNFKRNTTRINSSKINRLHIGNVHRLPQHFKEYFRHTNIFKI